MTTKAQRRLRSMPLHVAYLYALIREHEGNTVMCYRLAPSVKQLWDAIVEEDVLGTGYTAESLREMGWVARRVHVEEKE